LVGCLAALMWVYLGRQVVLPTWIPSPDGGPPHVAVYANPQPLDPPKIAPLPKDEQPTAWQFPYIVSGYENLDPYAKGGADLRLRVFSQSAQVQTNLAIPVARMLMLIYELSYQRLSIDHAFQYNNGIIDVYLCDGGQPGGEQRFLPDDEGDRHKTANCIFIYQVSTFTDPTEKAREVAHEYGHATLPGIGGYTKPEDWANGLLGEKLFLSWMREEMVAGRVTPDDTMGANANQLGLWLAKNVQPLVTRAAAYPPSEKTLARKDKVGMDTYLGLAMYAATILPHKVFARSIKLTGSTHATDYPQALILACAEPDVYALRFPAYLQGKKVWVPIGAAKISGAKQLQKKGAWVEIIPGKVLVMVAPKRSG